MLEIKGLTASYGTSQALFGVDMQVGEKEVVTLLGRNGMGKTTTIHSIMGIVRANGGSITFEGNDILARPSHKIAKLGLGLVPEGRQIFPNLSTMENLIATAANPLGLENPWTIDRVLELFPELGGRAQSMGNLLSGGEQQMLAIGRALMTNPKLLILDEATEGLAPLIRKKIWQALADIRGEGTSILVVDKNLRDLMALADRHYIMRRGQIVWGGGTTDLQNDAEARDTYLGL